MSVPKNGALPVKNGATGAVFCYGKMYMREQQPGSKQNEYIHWGKEIFMAIVLLGYVAMSVHLQQCSLSQTMTFAPFFRNRMG
ncbi:hypothetical protein [Saccharococcus caldoxylosilyticus]|uniref:Uncharacterized protein n=1 Tax=Parageobacillus caldoxylosilyticus NBRC 107762 TaxID=1220594 RepID=A0A023DFZ6_9BACL|nr:hypothetical protein [Parageobacillus caldoxylosilyticus]OQP02521.1 hypothetical protein BSK33_10180 [Geobacillus sp. 44B]MBB3853082.1 hypothetical protein [Parageobacillus caldoxylosilyticus]QNU39700.1 hypothetical protein IC801_04325 [Geobacillus sp. 44B]BDG34321.1 hypothetical protein PcaKH15_02270 [Parageobacillus caldoxylosilyticus]BDG38090.1 hypothetical protein PcaKH16_02290 [Parageobacillus caldoxylosilyticus]